MCGWTKRRLRRACADGQPRSGHEDEESEAVGLLLARSGLADRFAQPAMGLIGVDPAMPQHRQCDAGAGEWEFLDDHRADGGEIGGDAAGDHGDAFRPDQHEGDGEERDAGDDLAPKTMFLECFIHERRVVAFGVDGDVGDFSEGFRGQAISLCERVLGVEHGDVVVFHDSHAFEALSTLDETGDGEVDAVAIEHIENIPVTDGANIEGDVRGHFRDAVDEGWDEGACGIVVDGQGESSGRGGGIEAARLHGEVQNPQRFTDWLGHFLGALSGLHTFRSANEQLVAQGGAQACEGMAGGRLTEAEPAPGAGQVALLHHRVEGDKEIKVELVPVHDQAFLDFPRI
jgi:hypothetical protein